MKSSICPYLMFSGDAREAMELYHRLFGGELILQTYAEAPMESDSAHDDLVMHAHLSSDQIQIMASDGPPGSTIAVGDNVNVTIVGDDEQKLGEWFSALAEDGKVTLAYEKQFWGDTCGNVVDKFGVPWMLNATTPENVPS